MAEPLSPAERRFVVVTGLPGAGKTTLARALAPLLGLPVIDKDDILERLFADRGTGDRDWRRRLSRESDDQLQREAERSQGAILVSFWHQPGMAPDSGTPTGWIAALASRIVQVDCVCAPEVAAGRFVTRARHPGHLDGERSRAEVEESLRRLTALPRLELGERIEVDTGGDDLPATLRNLARHAAGWWNP